MQTYDKKTTIRGIMRNESLSKIIGEAYNSPVGSTKRAQAKKILSVMTKLNGGSFDGQGGPSIPYQEPAPPTYSRLMVFPAAPKMMTPEERKQRDQMTQMNDGQGGPIQSDPTYANNPSGTAGQYLGEKIGSGLKKAYDFTGNMAYLTGQEIASGVKGIVDPAVDLAKATRDFNVGIAAGVQGINITPPTMNPPINRPQPYGPVQPTIGADNPVSTTGTTLYGPSAPVFNTTGGSATPTTTTSPSDGGLPQAGSTPGGSSSSPTSKYSWLQQSINGNTGGTAFALGTMNDMDKLRQLFPGVKDEDLPHGASLVGQVNDLDSALRKEYNLDSILNEKQNLQATGVNLRGDLSDYIQGRDEFLNQTNDMIEKAKAKMLTSSDFADPRTQKANSQYLNYLYLLKGRQSKSYVDFLDSSVKKYEADLSDISNHYDTALSAYERELKSKTDLTTEQYSMYYNALTDMYKSAEDAPQKKLEMEKTKLQMTQIYSQMANDSIRAQADLLKASGKDNSTFMDSWANLQKIKAIDEKGNLNPNYTLTDAENLNSLGIPMTDYMQAILLSGRNAMMNPDPKDGTMPGMSTIMKTSESLMSNMKMLEQRGAYENDPQTQSMAQSSAEQVKADTKSSLKGNSGVLPVDQQAKLIDATSYLAKGGGWNPFSSNKTVSKDTFLSKYKDSGVDTKFLDALFTNYQTYGNGKDFANNILNEMDNVNGKVIRVRTPEEVRNKVIDMMVEKNFTF